MSTDHDHPKERAWLLWLLGGLNGIMLLLLILLPLFGPVGRKWSGTITTLLIYLVTITAVVAAWTTKRWRDRMAQKRFERTMSEIVSDEIDILEQTLVQRFGGEWQRPGLDRLQARFDFRGSAARIDLRATESGWRTAVSLAPAEVDPARLPETTGATRLDSLLHDAEARQRLEQRLEADAVVVDAGRVRVENSTASPNRNQVYRQLVGLQRLLNNDAGSGPSEGERCPYCRDPIDADPFVECLLCTAKHHQECWDEHAQRCAVFGCV